MILASFLKYGWFSFSLSVSSCFYFPLKHEFQPDMSLTFNFSSSALFLCSLPVCDNNLIYNILEKVRFSKISFLYISFQFCYHSSCLLCWSWINYKEKSNKNMPYGRYFFRKQSIQLKLVKYSETRWRVYRSMNLVEIGKAWKSNSHCLDVFWVFFFFVVSFRRQLYIELFSPSRHVSIRCIN